MSTRSRHPARRLSGTLRSALCALALAAPQAHALEPDLGSVVSRLPLSVDLVLAIDNGAALRKELGTMPLVLTLSTQPRPGAILDAWSGLAAEMGMTDAEAFDLLLGQRVIIAGSELQCGDTDDPRWALLSEIDPATERKLRDKLDAVPRRVVNGQVVSEFERGSFLMATSSGRLRCTESGAFQSTPAATLLLLAPAQDRVLFEQLLPLLHCRTPDQSLANLPVGRAVASMDAHDAVFLARLPQADGSPNRFVAANIGVEDGTWQLALTLAPAAGWVPGVDTQTAETWSPKLIESLPADPALVMVGTRPSVREARLWAMPLLGLPLPDPESAGLAPLLGSRSMFAVWLDDHSAGGPGPEVLMASDTPSLSRLIAPADGFLESRAGLAPGAAANARRQITADTQPLAPSEVRSMKVRNLAPSTTEATLNWLYVPEGPDGTLKPHPDQSADQPGWWVLHYQPHEGCDQSHAVRSQSMFTDMTPRRYLHVGRAEPRRWSQRVAALATEQPDGTPAQLLTSPFVVPQIWSIRWAVWYEPGDRAVRADIALRLAPPHPGEASAK